jgi:Tfp pilus assembly protein PilX
MLVTRGLATVIRHRADEERAMNEAECSLNHAECSLNHAECSLNHAACSLNPQPNLAEMLVTRGLATVIRHRADEERAMNYDALMCAEAKAIKSKKGIHSAKEAPVNHVNDLSGREATQKVHYFSPPYFTYFFQGGLHRSRTCEGMIR